MSLYRILGTRKNAKPETIKKAFRRRAIETHPDQGGDPEEFKRVREAWRILSNPEWRAYYDAHGEPPPDARAPARGEGAANSEESRVAALVVQTFEQVLRDNSIDFAEGVDLKARLLGKLREDNRRGEKEIERARDAVKKFRKVEARVISGDYIRAWFAQQIAAFEKGIADGEANLRTIEAATEWVAESFEYSFDRQSVGRMSLNYAGPFSMGSTSSYT